MAPDTSRSVPSPICVGVHDLARSFARQLAEIASTLRRERSITSFATRSEWDRAHQARTPSSPDAALLARIHRRVLRALERGREARLVDDHAVDAPLRRRV